MIASKVTGRSRTAMRGEAALTVTQISGVRSEGGFGSVGVLLQVRSEGVRSFRRGLVRRGLIRSGLISVRCAVCGAPCDPTSE